MPASHGEPLSTRQQPTETTILSVNLKSKLPTKLEKYASFGVIPKLFLLPFALGFIALILLIRPFVVIKFFKVNPWRIGHLLVEVEVARLNAIHASHTKKHIVFYYIPERRVANEFVLKIWKRELPTISHSWGWLLYTIASTFQTLSLTLPITTIDYFNLFQKTPSNFRFNEFEIKQGEKFLESVNCANNNFVCLMVRDSAYLETIRKDKSFLHYKYRDSNIDTYVLAAEALAAKGYTVFRMGQIVKDPIRTSHPNIIDYATNGMRSEFLDLYLGSKCKFCISTGTGFDFIPYIFRRPVMYVNTIGFDEALISRPFVIYPKIFRDLQTQKMLTLRELLNRNVVQINHAKDIDESDITICDLSAEEILIASLEMATRVEKTFDRTPEYDRAVNRTNLLFQTQSLLPIEQSNNKLQGEIASCFFERYPSFLD